MLPILAERCWPTWHGRRRPPENTCQTGTALRRTNDFSLAWRSGRARTSDRRISACGLPRMSTHRPSHVSMASCRTFRSFRRHSAARRVSRWCMSRPARSGNEAVTTRHRRWLNDEFGHCSICCYSHMGHSDLNQIRNCADRAPRKSRLDSISCVSA